MNDVGSVFLHKEFEFADGGKAQKFFVVIGRHNGVVIAAKTTSQQHGRGISYGCQPSDRFHNFYLPTGSCYFDKCTWVCLDEFYEFSDSELFNARFSGTVRFTCTLDAAHMKILQDCAKESEDITSIQENIINNSIVQ
ncbi:hypothetical protein F900_01069 [Acinetobacter modestus]|uniref:Uncharacterized protein n=1 Tax=Acinetobacter modestus TaxID=1776740 RepID=N9M271_9GAMM|nr:hypothetical protein [Acinetobacter modestus]ENX02623.1 hypothetical protein F900_01069 [Acinetobacter modestus]